MENNNQKILFFLAIISGLSCNTSRSGANQILTTQRKVFAVESNLTNLLDHFPEKIDDNVILLKVSPPSCPPTYDCSAQFGDIVLNIRKSFYPEEYRDMLKSKYIFKTHYSADNIILNFYEFKDSLFQITKCNRYYSNKYPFPYFENYDFGLGCKTDKKYINGIEYFNYTYTIPADLEVYVTNAKIGNFWKEDCNEKRPTTLDVWKNGFSKGFAISQENDMILFWAMVW